MATSGFGLKGYYRALNRWKSAFGVYYTIIRHRKEPPKWSRHLFRGLLLKIGLRARIRLEDHSKASYNLLTHCGHKTLQLEDTSLEMRIITRTCLHVDSR